MPLATSSARRLATLAGGIAATAALATGLSACGSNADTTSAALSPLAGLAPADAVRTAFENLGQASTVHVRTGLSLSQGASDSMTQAPDAMTDAQADALRNGSIDVTVSAPQGETVAQAMRDSKDAQQANPSSVDLSLNGAQGPLVAFRSVGGNAYAMADLAQLSTLSGSDLGKEATALGSRSPALQPITSAIVAGKWLEVSASELKSIEGIFDIGAGASGITPDLTSGFEKDIEAALDKDVTWTAGSTPGTYDAAVSSSAIVSDLYPDLQKLAGLSGDALPPKAEALSEMGADRTISLEVATAGDQVSSVTIDVLQFDHDPADLEELGPDPKVDVVATFDTTAAAVVAPTDTVSLDKQIPSLLMQLGASGA